jgi:hypothetical protein
MIQRRGGRNAGWSGTEYVDYVTARIPALRRLAYLLAGDEHRADDLIQQTTTKFYVKWQRARPHRPARLADRLGGPLEHMSEARGSTVPELTAQVSALLQKMLG